MDGGTYQRPAALRPARARAPWSWALAGAAVAALAVVVVARTLPPRAPADDRVVDELLASHVRSLMVDHLTDVASSDQHTVRPWFDGKLDFSPAVRDLAAAGFPLLGGRLDYVGGRAVAALVYGRRKHVINLFVWPAPPGAHAAGAPRVVRGYNLIGWTAAGTSYWAVSDVNASELEEFAARVRSEPAAEPVTSPRG